MVELPDANALYSALESLNLLEGKPPLWWLDYSTFVVGAVLSRIASGRRRSSRWPICATPGFLPPFQCSSLIRTSVRFGTKRHCRITVRSKKRRS